MLRRGLPLLIAVGIAFVITRIGRWIDPSGAHESLTSMVAFSVVMVFAWLVGRNEDMPADR